MLLPSNRQAAISTWLSAVTQKSENLFWAGWELARLVHEGIERLGESDEEKRELYELAAQATGKSIKRLRNMVSVVRAGAIAESAMELGLTIDYAAEVIGLPGDEALNLLCDAAEQGMSVFALRRLARKYKELPDNGNTTWTESFDSLPDAARCAMQWAARYTDGITIEIRHTPGVFQVTKPKGPAT